MNKYLRLPDDIIGLVKQYAMPTVPFKDELLNFNFRRYKLKLDMKSYILSSTRDWRGTRPKIEESFYGIVYTVKGVNNYPNWCRNKRIHEWVRDAIIETTRSKRGYEKRKKRRDRINMYKKNSNI